MRIRKFLIESNNIEKDSYIWNMVASMMMAFQSVIMLMILTRVLGLIDAGVFTIAYANANLFLTIGKFGMRNFQVSDAKDEFMFQDYRNSRIVTTIVMLLVAIIYVAITGIRNGYTIEKSWTIIWMCLFKVADSIEDVYSAFYQRRGRLDVASKAMALRIGSTILIFGIGLAILKDLLLALILSTIATTIIFIFSIAFTYKALNLGDRRSNQHEKKTKVLLWQCFPLFAGSFLAFYIGNAPKYAIDSLLNDKLQACYGFIAMPVFVIGLLNGFIFNPILCQMSILWHENKISIFLKKIVVQIGIIVAITGCCVIGAYNIGVPVLSFIYNTDLGPFKGELLILLFGGGFLGLSGFLATIITIMRYQKCLVWGYAIVAILALFLSPILVREYHIMGAAVLYLILMLILCAIFAIFLVFGIIRVRKKDRE